MKTRILTILLGAMLCGALAAQAQNLEAVLNSMDKAAANFHYAQTDFVWDQYQKVVDDHDFQKGVMYFRRQGNDVEVATDITSPAKKYVLFAGGMISLYQPPPLDQVTEYNAGKNKADFESFLVLGFGGRGHDLEKSFDVKYDGMEQAQGVNAAKLELTPKSPRGEEYVSDHHAVDRSGARRQRAAAVSRALGRLPPGQVQQHPDQQEDPRRCLQAEDHQPHQGHQAERVALVPGNRRSLAAQPVGMTAKKW